MGGRCPPRVPVPSRSKEATMMVQQSPQSTTNVKPAAPSAAAVTAVQARVARLVAPAGALTSAPVAYHH